MRLWTHPTLFTIFQEHETALQAADRKLTRQGEDLQALRGTCEGLRQDLDSKPLTIPTPSAGSASEGDPSGVAAVLGEMQRRLERKADADKVENLQRGVERAEADVAKVDAKLQEMQGRIAEMGAKEMVSEGQRRWKL